MSSTARLEFTLMVGCPLMCTFCPQSLIRGEYRGVKYMSVDTFLTVLDKLPKHVRIDFSGMAEPWANPHATEMLQYALQAGFRVAIYTTLYGMYDSRVVASLLREYAPQIDILVLHLPDANGNMTGWRPNDPDYLTALQTIMQVGVDHLFGRFRLMTMDRRGEVRPELADVVGQLDGWAGLDRAGNVDREGIQGADMTGPFRHFQSVSCAYTALYDQNVVLPNGDVVLCCMDYGLKHRLGNLVEQSYQEVLQSPALHELRALNQAFGWNDSLCKSCERARQH